MPEENNYKRISCLVDQWIALHIGETFDLDLICRQLDINKPENRHEVVKKLSYEVGKGKVEKSNRLYKYVNTNKKYIEWWKSSPERLDIRWPRSRGGNDNSVFGFDGHVGIRPADLIVVSGQSNWGKSTFARNFMAENLDQWAGKIQLMVNEYSPGRFFETLERMNWVDWMDAAGNPRFTMIERYEDWKYAIEPDWINIIDWIGLADNFYLIRQIMEGIQETLRNGICMVVLQKKDGTDTAEGGVYAEQKASAVFLIEQGYLRCKKIKEPIEGYNPQGQMYGFSILNNGAEFANIRTVKLCPRCSGKRKVFAKSEGLVDCETCFGLGFVDKELARV